MGIVNQGIGAIFDGLLLPFRSLPEWVALTVLSLLTAVGVLIVYKKTSDQSRIDYVKRRIEAYFYEIRLFNDDLRAILRAQGGILRYNGAYVALNLVPLLVMIVPFALIMAQLQAHYGWTGLRADEPVLVKATLAEDWEQGGAIQSVDGKPQLTLNVPSNMSVETRSVWIPSNRELAWRLVPSEGGEYEIGLSGASDALASKQLFVADVDGKRAPVRHQPDFLNQLLYPGEAPLPTESPVRSIEVAYPERVLDLFGYSLHAVAGIPAWMIIYFVLSMIFAFALKGRFGVTI